MAEKKERELSPFSHVILVLVGERGAGPHDILRMAREGRIYWAAAESQFYAEPKRLEKLGYLRSHKEPGRTRERTHYELTERGRDALKAWLTTPMPFPRIQHEAVARVLVADLVEPAVMVEQLEGLRAELAATRASIDRAEEIAQGIPHRARFLRLNHGLARRILDAHEAWIDEVESELGAEPRPTIEPPWR